MQKWSNQPRVPWHADDVGADRSLDEQQQGLRCTADPDTVHGELLPRDAKKRIWSALVWLGRPTALDQRLEIGRPPLDVCTHKQYAYVRLKWRVHARLDVTSAAVPSDALSCRRRLRRPFVQLCSDVVNQSSVFPMSRVLLGHASVGAWMRVAFHHIQYGHIEEKLTELGHYFDESARPFASVLRRFDAMMGGIVPAVADGQRQVGCMGLQSWHVMLSQPVHVDRKSLVASLGVPVPRAFTWFNVGHPYIVK